MTPEQRQAFAAELREKLNSLRETFTVDRFMFEPYRIRRGEHGEDVAVSLEGSIGSRRLETARTMASMLRPQPRLAEQKIITAAAVKLLLDYCESSWDMPFVEYCFGVFQSREPLAGEEAFDALPDTRSRISAERLGFGSIYGGKNT